MDQTTLAADQWVDEHAIAELLGISVKTLRNWRVQGKGPPFAKFGPLVRYNLGTTGRWAKARERTSTSEAAA